MASERRAPGGERPNCISGTKEYPAPEAADVLIVGAGIVGLACAHYLSESGRVPILLDRGQVGRGSSHGNAGLIAPSHSVPLPAPGVIRQAAKWLGSPTSPFFIKPRADLALARWLVRFAWSARRGPMLAAIPTLRDLNRLSAELYASLAPKLGPCPRYTTSGVLNIYKTHRGFEQAIVEAYLLNEYGVSSETIDGDALSAAEPGLREGLAGGILWPEDGFVDPAEFVAALSADLRKRAVMILEDTEVLSIASSARDVLVRTTSGVIRCQDVVVAAGAWSARLLRPLGYRLGIEPAKGYSITIHHPSTLLRRPLLLSEAKVAVTPLHDSLRLAGTLELSGLDSAIDLRRLDAVRSSADPYLAEGTHGASEKIWTGLRPLSADGLPVIGRLSRSPHVAVATGHGHIGVSLAPATGKLISELLNGVPPTVDTSALEPRGARSLVPPPVTVRHVRT